MRAQYLEGSGPMRLLHSAARHVFGPHGLELQWNGSHRVTASSGELLLETSGLCLAIEDRNNNNHISAELYYCNPEDTLSEKVAIDIIYIICIFLSCIFFLITFLVYLLLAQLRKSCQSWKKYYKIYSIKENTFGRSHSLFFKETDTFPQREFFRQVDDGFPPERLSQFLVEWNQTVP